MCTDRQAPHDHCITQLHGSEAEVLAISGPESLNTHEQQQAVELLQRTQRTCWIGIAQL